MAFATPQSTSPLNNPSHSLLHRILDIDTGAAAQSVVIDSSGRVGIGTTAPGYQVNINGAGTNKFAITNGAITNFKVIADGSDNSKLYIYNASGVAKVLLDSAGNSYLNEYGNVGIGTTSPGQKLDVNGIIRGNNDITTTKNANSTGSLSMSTASGSVMAPFFNAFSEDTGTGLYFRAKPTGAGTTGFSQAAYYLNAQTSGDVALTTGNLFQLSNANVPKVTIDYSGNVGIGTTTPGAKLEVYGANQKIRANSGAGYYIDLDDDSIQSVGTNLNINTGVTDPDVVIGQNNLLRVYTTSSKVYINGNLGIGTTTPTNILSLGNGAARKFWIENTATDVVGRALTVAAGGTVAGTSVSNVVGGQLILQSGLGTGTGDSSIAFQTGTTLTTGTTLQTMSTKMTILGNGNIGIGEVSPSFKLQIAGTVGTNNDIEITDTTKGVILKSANGTRFRLTIDNNGNLSTTSL